jgi:haloacetate dehalogenase
MTAGIPSRCRGGARWPPVRVRSGRVQLRVRCEEYRAAATLDHQHDEADRGRRRIACPVLVLWSHSGPVARWYRPLEVWRAWADEVHGGPVPAGHFLPEEAPDQTTRHLVDFFAGPNGAPARAPRAARGSAGRRRAGGRRGSVSWLADR